MKKKGTTVLILTSLIVLYLILTFSFSPEPDKQTVVDCSNTSNKQLATVQFLDHQKKFKEIQAILEKALHTQQNEEDGLATSPYLVDVIMAIAALDPDKGLSLFADLDTLYQGEGTTNVKAAVASALARVLTGSKRDEFLKACAKIKEKEVGLSVAYSASISSLEELQAIADLVDSTSAEGSLILLLAAGELKERSGDWQQALKMIKYQNKGNDPLAIANEIFQDYLMDDRNALEVRMKNMSQAEAQPEMIIAGSVMPLRSLLIRKTPATADHHLQYANFICEASKKIESDKTAFSLLGFVVDNLNDNPTGCIADQLKERWDTTYFSGSRSVGKYFAAFYAFKAMLPLDAPWATMVAEELVSSILAQENAKTYYHMVGTIAGVLATKDPERALEIAKKIKSLEWYANALRCIYRGWGKTDPEAAFSMVKKENFGMDEAGNKRMQADVMLEAAVGASFIDPELAADKIALLPDKKVRFTQGYCLVAPPLAVKDLDRALSLLLPIDEQPMLADAAIALAHIVLAHAGVDIDPTVSDFFPDYLRPRDFWPGPRFSQPIRF